MSSDIILEDFLHHVFELELYKLGSHELAIVHNAIMVSQQKVDLVLERVDQEALNKISLKLAETAVKRLEFQVSQSQLQLAKLYLQIFAKLANFSTRFRDTIRRSHNLQLWLNMLRASVQLELILPDVLETICSSIVDINAVFSAEYNYWKRFMPELMELYAQCHRKFQIVEIQLLRIFYHLLVDDFSFLACAHSHLEHKEFTQLIHIIVDITREKEIELSNYEFCDQLGGQLRTQLEDWPKEAAVNSQERRSVQKLMSLLKRVVDQKVHRFAQGAPSDDEEDVQAQDGDEEETSSSSDELQDEDKAVERDEDEESEHGHEHQQQKHPPHKLHNGEKPLDMYEKQKLNKLPLNLPDLLFKQRDPRPHMFHEAMAVAAAVHSDEDMLMRPDGGNDGDQDADDDDQLNLVDQDGDDEHSDERLDDDQLEQLFGPDFKDLQQNDNHNGHHTNNSYGNGNNSNHLKRKLPIRDDVDGHVEEEKKKADVGEVMINVRQGEEEVRHLLLPPTQLREHNSNTNTAHNNSSNTSTAHNNSTNTAMSPAKSMSNGHLGK